MMAENKYLWLLFFALVRFFISVSLLSRIVFYFTELFPINVGQIRATHNHGFPAGSYKKRGFLATAKPIIPGMIS